MLLRYFSFTGQCIQTLFSVDSSPAACLDVKIQLRLACEY